MPTLYKKASKNQMKLLRAVAGAVLNEADAHGRIRDEKQARSIAKRAVGTISALWPDVLVAARQPSSNGVPVGHQRANPHLGNTKFCPECTRRSYMSRRGAKRGVKRGRVAPLYQLIKHISHPLGEMKKTDPARADVYIEVLKKADKIVKGVL